MIDFGQVLLFVGGRVLSHDKLTKTEDRWRRKNSDLSDFTGKSIEKIKIQVLDDEANGSTLISRSYYGPGHEGRSANDRDD